MQRTDHGQFIYHPKRDYDCRSFYEILSPELTDALVRIGNEHLAEKSLEYADQCFKALTIFAHDFLSSNNSRPADNARQGVFPIGRHAECAALARQFDTFLHSKFDSRYRRNHHRAGMRFWFRRLATEGLMPQGVSLKGESPRGDGSTGQDTTSATLVDFSLPEEARAELEDHVAWISAEDRDRQEAETIFEHIAKEYLAQVPGASFSHDDVPHLVAQILGERLEQIRQHAETEFQKARRERAKGLLMVRAGRKHLSLFLNWMAWAKGPGQGKVNPYKEAVHQLRRQQFDEATLAWCYFCNGGIFFRWNYHENALYQRWSKAKASVGSDLNAEVAQDLIGCGTRMTIAAQIILVHDLTANVSSVRELTVDADYASFGSLRGVQWSKVRAGKVLTLLDHMSQEYSSPSKVARVVRNATKKYRDHCIPSDKDSLFLLNFQNYTRAKSKKSGDNELDQNPISRPSDTWFCHHAKKVIGAAANSEWVGTTKSIRQSILLYDALVGGVLAVQESAQHQRTTTSTAYSNKLPMRVKLDIEIRSFLRWMQTLVAVNVDDFASKVGIDEAQFQEHRQEILNSHFGGLHCRDPRAGVQPGTTKGEVCGEISQCMSCPNRRHLFVTTESNVVHLLMWNDALVYAYKAGILANPPEREWKMWSLFIRSILDRLESKRELRALLAGARATVGQVLNPYLGYFPPAQEAKVGQEGEVG